MISDGRKTKFEVRVTERGVEIEMERLVHPPDVDIPIIRSIIDAIQRLDQAGHGVIVTVKPSRGK